MYCYQPNLAILSNNYNIETGECSKQLHDWMFFKSISTEEQRKTYNKRLRSDRYIKLPCGKCNGCTVEKSKTYGLRAVHEMYYTNESTFLNLSYDRKNCPRDYGLVPRDLTLFIKRLRKYIDKHYNKRKIRYLACGEYGTKHKRPHYHLVVFGFQFKDLVLDKTSKSGHPVYTSVTLDKIWGKGETKIGHATKETAQYVARYCTKKQEECENYINHPVDYNCHGDVTKWEKRIIRTYDRIRDRIPDPKIEIGFLKLPFIRSSLGLGKRFCLEFLTDMFPKGYITSQGKDGIIKNPVPRYYQKLCARYNHSLYLRYLETKDLYINKISAKIQLSYHTFIVNSKNVINRLSKLKREIE